MMQQAKGYVICYFLSNGGVVYTGGRILLLPYKVNIIINNTYVDL